LTPWLTIIILDYVDSDRYTSFFFLLNVFFLTSIITIEETLNKSITSDQIQKRHNKETEKLAVAQKKKLIKTEKKIDSVYI